MTPNLVVRARFWRNGTFDHGRSLFACSPVETAHNPVNRARAKRRGACPEISAVWLNVPAPPPMLRVAGVYQSQVMGSARLVPAEILQHQRAGELPFAA